MKNNKISLQTAKKWAKEWRESESTYNKYNECRAFNIPLSDFQDMVKEKGVASVRGYIGVAKFVNEDTKEVIYEEKLMLVGVDANGKDMIKLSKDGETLEGDESGIYDFTQPCPNYCDPNSPLNGPT